MAEKRIFWDRLTSLLKGGWAGAHTSSTGKSYRLPAEAPLRREWATYLERKSELLAREGQWVVIHGEQILGIRPTYEEALQLGYERAGFVDFLVHQIRETDPVHPLPPQPI
jgi:hypothetical protein